MDGKKGGEWPCLNALICLIHLDNLLGWGEALCRKGLLESGLSSSLLYLYSCVHWLHSLLWVGSRHLPDQRKR
jgi:hypothetical protein